MASSCVAVPATHSAGDDASSGASWSDRLGLHRGLGPQMVGDDSAVGRQLRSLGALPLFRQDRGRSAVRGTITGCLVCFEFTTTSAARVRNSLSGRRSADTLTVGMSILRSILLFTERESGRHVVPMPSTQQHRAGLRTARSARARGQRRQAGKRRESTGLRPR